MLPAEESNGENSEEKQENPKSEEQENSVCFDIVGQILLRLPVKPLLRFRSVSKFWLALTCSPKFIKSHLSLSANNNKDYTNHRVMLRIVEPKYNLKDCSLRSLLYDESAIEEFDLDYPMKNSSTKYLIEGSVNGLVCLANDAKELILWNPSIKRYKKLPDLKTELMESRDIYGFGYDEIHNNYKVVSIFSTGTIQEVNIYNLKNDSWRRIDCPRRVLTSSGQFLNGKLHWATTFGVSLKPCWSITSFDLTDEKWGKVELPDYGEEGDGIFVLGVLQNNLSMICSNPDNHVDVWVMTEYGDKESWKKMFSINYTQDPLFYWFSQSIFMSNRGEVLLMFQSELIIYDSKENSIRYPQISKFDYDFMAEIYIERAEIYIPSLVCPLSLNEPMTQPERRQQKLRRLQ